MNTSFNLGGTILWMEEAAHGLELKPEYDGARVELTVKAYANQAVPQMTLQVSGTLQAGHAMHHERHVLTSVTASNLVTVNPTPTGLAFGGHVSAQALREVEEMRGGGPVWLVLSNLRAIGLTGERTGLTEFTGGELAVQVLSQEWSTEMEKIRRRPPTRTGRGPSMSAFAAGASTFS